MAQSVFLDTNITDFQGFHGIRPVLPEQWKDIT